MRKGLVSDQFDQLIDNLGANSHPGESVDWLESPGGRQESWPDNSINPPLSRHGDGFSFLRDDPKS